MIPPRASGWGWLSRRKLAAQTTQRSEPQFAASGEAIDSFQPTNRALRKSGTSQYLGRRTRRSGVLVSFWKQSVALFQKTC